VVSKIRLSEEDLCPNQMKFEGMKFCNEIYGLFRYNAEDPNYEGKVKRVNKFNECKNMNNAIAEGKYEHNDACAIRNLEARNFTLENE
jgi:hypothetical protein